MDCFTHYIYGYGVGRQLYGAPSSPEVKALIMGALVPDIDFLLILGGVKFFRKYHRQYTHSIFTAPVLGLILAGILKKKYGRSLIKPVMIGIGIHLFLDLFDLPRSMFEYLFPKAEFNKGVDKDRGVSSRLLWPVSDEMISMRKTFGYSDVASFGIFIALALLAIITARHYRLNFTELIRD